METFQLPMYLLYLISYSKTIYIVKYIYNIIIGEIIVLSFAM